MFALIWVTLLFTATGSVESDNKTCEGKTFTVTLKPISQRAAAGQFVVLGCSFEINITSFAWCQNDQFEKCKMEIFNSSKTTTNNSEIEGRVSLLEPDLMKKNCSIIIKNLTTSDTGVYKVRATAADGCTRVSKANITVEVSPKISNDSGCWNQSNFLTCVCISEGFPPLTITWPLLDNISEYSLSTNVSALSVTSHMTVPLEKFSSVTVECVSRDNTGETKQILSISVAKQPENSNTSDKSSHQNMFSRLIELFKEKMISVLIVFGIGFLIGSLVTAFIACLVTKCHRNKKKNSHSTDELELVNADAVFKDWDNEIPQVENNGILNTQDDGIQHQAAAECGEELPGDLIDSDMSPKETVYSDIDFSALKEKDPADAKDKEETTETEYAEIKRGEMEEAQENEGMDCKMLERNDEMEVMIEHQEDSLYHSKNEVMDEN